MPRPILALMVPRMGKTARLSIEVAITFGGLFIFQLADGRHVCL
jgi:hypothetical protein